MGDKIDEPFLVPKLELGNEVGDLQHGPAPRVQGPQRVILSVISLSPILDLS